MQGVENHWIEYNESENTFGAWSTTELLNVALFTQRGMLWEHITVNFFLGLGKRSVIRELVNGFIIPQKEKMCLKDSTY